MNNMRTNFMYIGEMESSLEDDDLINHIALRFMISELGKSIMVKVKKKCMMSSLKNSIKFMFTLRMCLGTWPCEWYISNDIRMQHSWSYVPCDDEA